MAIDNWMVWIIIAIVLFIVELVTPGTFFFFCIGVGAVVAAVASSLVNPVITWIVFFVVSIIMIVISRPIARGLNREKTRDANADELIGKKAKVTELIDADKHPGMAKIDGEVWLAKSEERIEKNEDVDILRIEGNYLIVEKVKGE